MAVGVNVRWIDREFYVDLCDSEEQLKSITVLQLKQKIIENSDGEYVAHGLWLIFTGKVLQDSALLSDYGVQHMSVVHCVRMMRGGNPLSGKGDDSMGDKDKNRSMEKLALF